MELSPKQQTTELIKKSQKILIVGKKHPDGDTIGSMLALRDVLTGFGKDVLAVSSENIGPVYSFLPHVRDIKEELQGSSDFVIKIDVKDSMPEKLYWNEKDGTINIIITPKEGTYDESRVSFGKGFFDFDLVIVLDTADVDSIDKIYDKSTDLFFEKPVINIDHHAGNEYFGTVNLVDITATSTAEILVSITEALNPKLLTEEVATNLLAGIIYDTGSFKNKNTTPKSLTVSAQLLAAGARQQEIIDNFYKTKSISTLKLWGKILSGLKFEEESRFVCFLVKNEDFVSSGMNMSEVENVLDELLSNTPGADIVLVLIEKEKGKFTGLLKGQRGSDVLSLAEIFKGGGQFHDAKFEINNISVEDVELDVVERMLAQINERFGLVRNDIKKVLIPLQKMDREKYALEKEVIEVLDEEMLTEEDEAVQTIKNLVDKGEHEAKDAPEDAIDEAIRSLEKEGYIEREPLQKETETEAPPVEDKKSDSGYLKLGDILKNKAVKNIPAEDLNTSKQLEDEEFYHSESELYRPHDEDDEPEVRVWKDKK